MGFVALARAYTQVEPLSGARLALGAALSFAWLIFETAKAIDAARDGIRSSNRSALIAVALLSPALLGTLLFSAQLSRSRLFAALIVEAPFDASDR